VENSDLDCKLTSSPEIRKFHPLFFPNCGDYPGNAEKSMIQICAFPIAHKDVVQPYLALQKQSADRSGSESEEQAWQIVKFCWLLAPKIKFNSNN
jgi:hypothetical protein